MAKGQYTQRHGGSKSGYDKGYGEGRKDTFRIVLYILIAGGIIYAITRYLK